MAPSVPVAAEQEKVLRVSYDGTHLSVNAVNAGAVELLRKIAEEARFKLVTSGFPEGFKVNVSFSNLPLEKGIDRVIKALRSDASVSHVAVYERKGREDVLYSLRVSHSGGPRQRPAPVLPAPRQKVIRRQPQKALPAAKKKPAAKEAEQEKKRVEFEKWLEREFVRELMDSLREEGWSEEEIMKHLRSLRGRRE